MTTSFVYACSSHPISAEPLKLVPYDVPHEERRDVVAMTHTSGAWRSRCSLAIIHALTFPFLNGRVRFLQ